MQISYSHELIAITIQEDSKSFYFLQNLIDKNFSKRIGKKNKIIVFNQENESVQKKYFLKLISKIYKRKNPKSKQEDIEKILNATDKNIKLTLLKKNQILQKIDIDMRIEDNYVVVFTFDINNSILIAYLRNYFKDHLTSYRSKNRRLTIYPNSYKTIELLDKLLMKKELLGSYVEFKYNLKEYKEYKDIFNSKKERKRRYNALFSLLEEYYNILDCKVEDSFETIRQKYLKLVKEYHPDKITSTNSQLIENYTQKFHSIQYAYEMIKTHYNYERSIVA